MTEAVPATTAKPKTELLTGRSANREYGTDRGWIRERIKCGDLRAIRRGKRRTEFFRRDFEALLRRYEIRPGSSDEGFVSDRLALEARAGG